MITEDYCSFELSELLREKGFDGLCHRYDFEDWRGKHTDTITKLPNNFNENNGSTSIPTHQMAMKWLREKHNIHIAIDRGLEHYFVMITKMKPYQDIDMKNDVYDSFEEAVDAALKYALENLI